MTETREHTTSEPTESKGRFARAGADAAARQPRRRHEVPGAVRPLLRPFFRYSYSRDAWVLLGVGSKHGPVIRDL